MTHRVRLPKLLVLASLTLFGCSDPATSNPEVSNPGTSNPSAPPQVGQPSHTRAGCLDGDYREPFSNRGADVTGILAAYAPGANPEDAANALIVDLLEDRFPIGAHLVETGYDSGAFEDCSLFFIEDLTSTDSVVAGVSGAVHECGHAVDLQTGDYVITEQLTFACPYAAIADSPPRSALADDDYARLRPPCARV